MGDAYSPRACLLGCALIDLGCAFLGNPFPSCVYIGHSAFKAMGCRVGYLYLNMVPTVYFGWFRGAGLLQRVIPIESGVGFMLWVGLQITAQGFEGDNTPEGWRHGPAVALGLLPSISAWSWQTVTTTFGATRTMLCEQMEGAVRARTPECNMELYELMQAASTPMETAGTPIGDFQRHLQSLYLAGMFALSNGYLLSAISLSSMLVHIIDTQFQKAAVWLLLSAAASSVGIIHSRTLDPYTANQLFPVMYTIAAAALLLCHALQNRAEQLRELQVRWGRRLVRLCELCPSAPLPLKRSVEGLGVRLGLLKRDSSGRIARDHSALEPPERLSSIAGRLSAVLAAALFDSARPSDADDRSACTHSLSESGSAGWAHMLDGEESHVKEADTSPGLGLLDLTPLAVAADQDHASKTTPLLADAHPI